MPRIPRSEQTVGVSATPLPMHSGNADAVGRGIQQLGQGIGAALSGLMDEQTKADEFAAKLEESKFLYDQHKKLDDSIANNTGDGRGFHQSWEQGFDQDAKALADKYAANPKISREMQLRLANARHSYGMKALDGQQRLINQDTVVRTNKYSDQVASTVTDDLGSVDRALATVGAGIDQAPGITTTQRSHLKAYAGKMIMQQWIDKATRAGADPEALEKGMSVLEGRMKEWSAAREPAPGAGAATDAKTFLRSKLAPGYENRTSDVDNLHPVMQDRLAAFTQAAEKAGYDIRIVSGHRDNERQAALFAAAVKKYGSEMAARSFVAPPGGSTHQSGEAVDLQYGDRKPGLGGTETAAVKWAHANAEKFGLNFPLSHEDWHIEPTEARSGGKRFGGKYDTSKQYFDGGGNSGGITPKLTAYSPQAGGGLAKMEGGYGSAKPGPDGQQQVATLEDFASGKSPYVTIAGDPSQNGKKYTIPRIEWIDSSGKPQVSENVPDRKSVV